MPVPQWFRIVDLAGEPKNADNPRRAKIDIVGQIGEDWWTGQGITAGPFMRSIDAMGVLDEIDITMNTPGGDVMDGLTITNYLINHPAKVTVRVVGQAASIGSVILMAGDERIMGLGTTVFVHDPISGLIGDADEMRQLADELDVIRDGIIEVYQSRVDLSRDELITLMRDDTRMTADEAVAWGFASGKDIELKAAACDDMGPILAHARKQAQDHVARAAEAENLRTERDQLQASVSDLQQQIDALRRGPEPADPALVISACAAAGIANLADSWVRDRLTQEQVDDRLARCETIRGLCLAAGENPVAYLVDDPTETLRIAFAALQAARDVQIDNTLQPDGSGGGGPRSGTAEIYRHRNQTKVLMRKPT